ncbi:PREDICTED: uncharacterized protein LOC108557445 [Nicrophorus vespilloides]|uniref:Uncharacterized protein LOC108557445 n=1 Tax=Nicrophorus vespilloides TaxID=110193 RepID=A0ABM1M4E0_NICVS|nr:PREDICTED: uncharacterized protein LOC108557445 [Nicrophorus vespilloides]
MQCGSVRTPRASAGGLNEVGSLGYFGGRISRRRRRSAGRIVGWSDERKHYIGTTGGVVVLWDSYRTKTSPLLRHHAGPVSLYYSAMLIIYASLAFPLHHVNAGLHCHYPRRPFAASTRLLLLICTPLQYPSSSHSSAFD